MVDRPSSEPLLTVAEACAYLKVGRTLLFQAMAQDEIDVVRLGKRSVRFTTAALDAFAERRTEYARASTRRRRRVAG